MKLFYSPGACSLAPHIVLRELALPFTLVKVDIEAKTTEGGEDFMVINPKGYVPALQLDDGEVLTEGPAITQYLADKNAPGVLAPAAGTVERARVNGHLTYIGTELHKTFSPLFNPAIAPEARTAVLSNLDRKLATLDRALADKGPFLAGPDFTIADAYLFAVQRWASKFGIDLTKFQHLVAFAKNVAARPAVKAALQAERQL